MHPTLIGGVVPTCGNVNTKWDPSNFERARQIGAPRRDWTCACFPRLPMNRIRLTGNSARSGLLFNHGHGVSVTDAGREGALDDWLMADLPPKDDFPSEDPSGGSPPQARRRQSQSMDSDATQLRHNALPSPKDPRDEEFHPVLICLSGELRGQRRALDCRELIIGRGSAADWHIDDGITSRTHALISYENHDDPGKMPRCYVEDLGSRNGTELNGKPISGRTRLVERDRLLVGTTIIGFFIRDADELQNEMSLYHSATRDPLTGLENRRQLLATVKLLMGRPRLHDRGFAFLLLDLDRFKSVNDTHGHDVGDQALKHVASIIRQTVRENDSPSRWGGEEFAVILPGVSPRGALRVAENLRRAIASQPLRLPDLELSLTVSVGVTVWTEGDSMESIFQRADQLLYQAKQAGRNRVTCDEVIARVSATDPFLVDPATQSPNR